MPTMPWPDSPLLRDWRSPEISQLSSEVAARRAAGKPVHDFITAHPYDHGFRFNETLLGEIMAKANMQSLRSASDPLGQLHAREAIANVHDSATGFTATTSPENILLTPGTSLAYFYLFRLFARTHGEVLCPAPTYPLFDDLARIAGLGVRRYHLYPNLAPTGETRWAIDPEELAFQMTPQTCAIVLVSPHNPTGTITSNAEIEAVCEIANRAAVPVIMDEVFRNYTRIGSTQVPRPSEHGCSLSFTLNGLSKSHYLPGIKAGWIVTEGNTTAAKSVTHALEYMSDTFLPVQEITQAALPVLLGGAAMYESERLAALQRERLMHRLDNSSGWPVTTPEAGPYICVPLESIASDSLGDSDLYDDEKLSHQILSETGALFHPGRLYAFPVPYLVATVFNSSPWPSPVYSPKT